MVLVITWWARWSQVSTLSRGLGDTVVADSRELNRDQRLMRDRPAAEAFTDIGLTDPISLFDQCFVSG